MSLKEMVASQQLPSVISCYAQTLLKEVSPGSPALRGKSKSVVDPARRKAKQKKSASRSFTTRM